MSLERQEDNTNNPWWGEHLNRYEEALRFLPTNGKILDIACGSGFGSNFLSEKGYDVIGGDISGEAIEACKKKYTSNKFEVCDGTKLSFENETFDSVVSFETIEHTTAFNEMLEEFKRVTKKSGVVLISTPNIVINSPSGKVTNPFHTQEWNYEDLQKILKRHFPYVDLYGQQYNRYKNKAKLNFRLGNILENFLYQRGVRKLPVTIQDALMKMTISQPMYPMSSNYELVSDINEVVKCKTFFAVCKLK